MLNASTIEQLRAMKFSAMAAAFEQQLKEPKSYSQLGFEERFGLMVDGWCIHRRDRRGTVRSAVGCPAGIHLLCPYGAKAGTGQERRGIQANLGAWLVHTAASEWQLLSKHSPEPSVPDTEY
ncbi:MAG: hypothetical protein E7337_15480 [Clostridiales bacterium]|nr:hypothetical protein [Clostridiales bacterium]